MRILVTGGSGFLGVNLIKYLLREGFDINSLDIENYTASNYNDIFVSRGNILSEKQVNFAMQDCGGVVHCASALPSYGDDKLISETIVRGTKNVCAAAFTRNIPMVHISSTAIYGLNHGRDGGPMNDGTAHKPAGVYGYSKWLAEEWVHFFRDVGTVSGWHAPIIRPKTFIGPERLGVFSLLYEMAYQGKRFPIIGRGDNIYQLLDVRDLCRLILIALVSSSANMDFDFGADEYDTIKSDFGAVYTYAGNGGGVVSAPKLPSLMLLRLLDKLKMSPLYPWVYETMHRDSYVSNKTVHDVLGYKCKYSNKKALVENYKWYVGHREQLSEGRGHTKTWKRGALEWIIKMM